jgi:hypothetical protein
VSFKLTKPILSLREVFHHFQQTTAMIEYLQDNPSHIVLEILQRGVKVITHKNDHAFHVPGAGLCGLLRLVFKEQRLFKEASLPTPVGSIRRPIPSGAPHRQRRPRQFPARSRWPRPWGAAHSASTRHGV